MSELRSYNPSTGELLWSGLETTPQVISASITLAREAFSEWAISRLQDRQQILNRYAEVLKTRQDSLVLLISQETGKPLWESKSEVASMIQKVAISIEAYQERCPEKSAPLGKQKLVSNFRPHGVVAVFGPFNFPGHLPNGHLVPALLAGNTVLFKPSELTPAVGEAIFQCFQEAGLPPHVLQLIQGGPSVGKELASHPHLDGLFFTGSAQTGQLLNEQLAKTPGKILALEMGGNNPLIVSQVDNLQAAAYLTIQSAFLTSGQRCSCARRLILPNTSSRDKFLVELIGLTKKIRVGAYSDQPEPFMGPVIDQKAAHKLLQAQELLLKKGGKALLPLQLLHKDRSFLSPGLLDVTAVKDLPDEEYFGPLLQIIQVENFEDALAEANRTAYGLTTALFSNSEEEWNLFYRHIRAGIINWNAPLTGASSKASFGGLGKSGNHRPSAYLAADYCSYPVASLQASSLELPATLPPGIG